MIFSLNKNNGTLIVEINNKKKLEIELNKEKVSKYQNYHFNTIIPYHICNIYITTVVYTNNKKIETYDSYVFIPYIDLFWQENYQYVILEDVYLEYVNDLVIKKGYPISVYLPIEDFLSEIWITKKNPFYNGKVEYSYNSTYFNRLFFIPEYSLNDIKKLRFINENGFENGFYVIKDNILYWFSYLYKNTFGYQWKNIELNLWKNKIDYSNLDFLEYNNQQYLIENNKIFIIRNNKLKKHYLSDYLLLLRLLFTDENKPYGFLISITVNSFLKNLKNIFLFNYIRNKEVYIRDFSPKTRIYLLVPINFFEESYNFNKLLFLGTEKERSSVYLDNNFLYYYKDDEKVNISQIFYNFYNSFYWIDNKKDNLNNLDLNLEF